MKVSPPGGQICKQCKWRHEVAKFVINKIIRVQDLTAWFRCAPSNVFRKDTIGKCMKNFFLIHGFKYWTQELQFSRSPKMHK